jgi:hypothetical protein
MPENRGRRSPRTAPPLTAPTAPTDRPLRISSQIPVFKPDLEPKILVAAEVGDRRTVGQLRQAVDGSVGTEAMQSHPSLSDRPRGLGRPLEDDGRFGEAELAPVIVVLPHAATVAGGGSGVSPCRAIKVR